MRKYYEKVTGYIDVRSLGHYDWEFYVGDNATDEDIKKKVDDICDYYIHYDVEEGYEAYTEVCYRKKE